MKRLSSLLLIAAAAAVLMSRIYSRPESEAGAVLDASRFANLQAALDALPETGGLVRIPPGHFELERPLLLEKENTKLEGSGPGTLLVNRNTAGEPALMVRNKERATNLASNAIAHNYGGIDLRDAWGCSVSSNTFTIVPTHSLRIGPGSGRIAVTGNTFSNSWIGGQTRRPADPAAEWPRMSDASGVLLESTSDVTLTGNIFSGLVDPAVQTHGECRRIALSGNVAVEVNQRATGTREAFDLKGADPMSAQENIESLAHGSR